MAKTEGVSYFCFHSIGIPSEWGFALLEFFSLEYECFHSIGIPSEWGFPWLRSDRERIHCFHSIGIPSEWGFFEVSNYFLVVVKLFPFNWYPQRVGIQNTKLL